jgi:hypothetical protein
LSVPRFAHDRRAIGAVLVALLVVAGCSGDDGGEAAPERTPRPSVVEAASGELRSFSVRRGPNSVLTAVVSLRAERPLPARVVAEAEGHRVEVPPTEAAGVQDIPVVGLRAETAYDLSVQLVDGDEVVGSGTARLETPPVPDSLPSWDVAVSEPERMAPGVTIFDAARWGTDPRPAEAVAALMGLDEDGELVWYYASDQSIGDAEMTDRGTVVMMVPPFGIREIDVLGNEVRLWQLASEPEPGGPVEVAPGRYGIDYFHHEASLLPNGNLLTIGATSDELSPAEQEALCPGDPDRFGFRDDVIVEFTPEGELVHQWALSEIVDPRQVPGAVLCEEDAEYRDWAHANGAIIDPARNAVIVTARHIDLMVAFRYQDDAEGPSGELLWSLGPEGTLPLDGDHSYHLHAPELEADGSILLYDNGNGRPGAPEPYSRAVQYAIDDSSPDPADWSARQVWEHRTDDDDGSPLYADFLADADRLPNGNVLIDHGGIGQREPPARARIIEVVPEPVAGGEIVFDVRLEDTYVAYRAERLPSLYP